MQCEDFYEESKLEQKFNQLAINLPKSSKHQHNQPVGGSNNTQTGCNLGKNIPSLQKVKLSMDKKAEQIQQHKRITNHNENLGPQGNQNQNAINNNDESGSSCSSGGMSQSFSSGNGGNQQQIQPKSGKSQIEILVQALNQYDKQQLEQLFIMHYDPEKQNKLVLTELQFTLLRKVYLRAFQQGRWSLSDDQ